MLRALVITLLCLGLAGCGFRPLYGAGDGGLHANQALSQIAVASIEDRPGQMLRNLLIDRLTPGGYPDKPAFRLEVSLREEQVDFGIRKDATATRAQLNQFANFRLVDTATGQPVFSGQARSVNSYNILSSEFGTLVTEDSARDRGLRRLADDIVTRIALHFGT